jgi:hypothetical protein
MKSLELKWGIDFAIHNLDEGLPLPVVKGAAEGIEIAALGTRAIHVLKAFDIRLRFIDSVGDTHERSVKCLLPLQAERSLQN